MQRAEVASPRSFAHLLWWAYEIALAALALAVIWLLTLPEEGWVSTANWLIWAVFATDYLVRLAIAPDRRKFIRGHIPELIAALPLEPFRVLRIARLARLLRAGAVLWRLTRNIRQVLGTNGLSYVLVFTGAVIVLGSAGIWLVEPGMESFGNALWWSVVTATTVGYGDLSPTEPLGRVIAVCLMMVGIGTIGMITGSIATHFIAKKPIAIDPDVEHIRERLGQWAELPFQDRRQIASMLHALVESDPPASV